MKFYVDGVEVDPDPLTLIGTDEPGTFDLTITKRTLHRRRDFALILGASAVIAIVLLLVGGTRV